MFTREKLARIQIWIILLSLLPVLTPISASASQITNRSLAISDSTPGKTAVSYVFTFTPTATANIGVVAFKFCKEDPLQGTTCNTPDAAATPVMTTTSATGGTLTGQTGTWSPNVATNGQPYVTASSTQSFTATATTVTFNNITNPNPTNGATYYAKIWTCTGTTICADSAAVDYGGIAWAVETAIIVTAKVQETLVMCAYVTGTCASPTGSTADLGVLSTSQISAVASKFEIATNSQNGAIVQYFGATLTSGANTIAAAGSTPFTMVAGTEKFGLNVATTNANFKNPSGTAYVANQAPSGSAPIAAVSTSPTDFTATNAVSFVTSASAPTNATPTSRNSQTLAFATAPINQTLFVVNYAAAISSTTKPGIYTTTVQYVGTAFF